MSRKIPKLKEDHILAEMGLPNRKLLASEVSDRFSRSIASEMLKQKQPHDYNEDSVIDRIDQSREFTEMMAEHLVSYKKLKYHKDIDGKLKALANSCPDILATALFTGNQAEKLKAVKEILDRVQGKPIERTMNLNMAVENKTEAEIDNELKRLEQKFRREEGVSETVVVEGSEARGNKG